MDKKVLFPLLMGTVLNPLNSTMLATALLTICQSFHRNAADGALLIVPLYVAAAVGQPLMGRLADLFNPKKVYIAGLLLILIAAAIGALAPAFWWLILSRVLLGLGTSAAYPCTMAIVAHQSEKGTVPRSILGLISVSAQATLVLGPILGGFVTQYLGWTGIFTINIPWVLGSLYVTKWVPSISRPPMQLSLWKQVDPIGIFLFSGLLTGLFMLLTTDLYWGYLILFTAGLVAFVFWEISQQQPFIKVQLFGRQPALLMVYFRILATNYVLYLVLYALPQWLESVKMLSPGDTGLISFPMSLASGSVALATSRRGKLSWIYVLAILTMICACSGIFLLNQNIPLWAVIGIMLIFGAATGINGIANQAALSEETLPENTGASFGLLRTFSYLGAILSGVQLKTSFKTGVTDANLHHAGKYAVICCTIFLVLYGIHFLRKRWQSTPQT